jgi:hypothetical protein
MSIARAFAGKGRGQSWDELAGGPAEERDQPIGVEVGGDAADQSLVYIEEDQAEGRVGPVGPGPHLLERRRAVRCGRDEACAFAGRVQVQHRLSDLITAAEPPREGRHRHRRILADQGYERGDVVAFERFAIAGEQLTLSGVGRPERFARHEVNCG